MSDELELATRRHAKALADLNTLRARLGMVAVEALDTDGWLRMAGDERLRQWKVTEAALADILARLERIETALEGTEKAPGPAVRSLSGVPPRPPVVS